VKPAAVVAALAAPSAGPAIVTIAGADVPVLALSLSLCALVLSRMVAPKSLRKLSRTQEIALTLLLLILLFTAVIGELPFIGDGKPLRVGMAVIWGIGLGFSGLLVIELMGNLVSEKIRQAFGLSDKQE